MTVLRLIEAANEFVEAHPEVPLVSDTGDCLFAAVEIQSNDCVAPAYYATMGFAIPAALGLQVSSGRRPLVLVGDGAFQMTGSEISHARRSAATRSSCSSTTRAGRCCRRSTRTPRYNETVPWPFARLAELWGGRGVVAATLGELRAALREAWHEPRFTLIEVPLAKGDISPVLEPLRRRRSRSASTDERRRPRGPTPSASSRRRSIVPEADRAAFVDTACAGNPALRDEVRSLLIWHNGSTGFLETPAGQVADLPAEAASAARLIGTSVGAWRILDVIGSGGMGVVYRAERADAAFRRARRAQGGAARPRFAADHRSASSSNARRWPRSTIPTSRG